MQNPYADLECSLVWLHNVMYLRMFLYDFGLNELMEDSIFILIAREESVTDYGLLDCVLGLYIGISGLYIQKTTKT